MHPRTKQRIILIDDFNPIRTTLSKFLTLHGYEVFSFSNPMICPLQIVPECRCEANQTCADVIISDLDMPGMSGLTFIENQRKKACKCRHIALISGLWTDEKLSRAQELGCKTFPKPIVFEEILRWAEALKAHMNPKRELCRWFEDVLSELNAQSAHGK